MTQDLKQFLTDFRSVRGWSLKEMAALLGYGSATSLVRLEQDKANLESLQRFARLMHQTEAVQMTPEEAQALDMLIERRQLSDDAYRATVLLHSLLRNEPQADGPVYVRSASTDAVLSLHDHFADRKITGLLLLNCLDMPFYGALARLVTESGIPVRHYLAVSDEASHIVRRVLRILPMTYLNSYSAYTIHLPDDQPVGLQRTDALFCEYEDHGARCTEVLVANRVDHFDSHMVPAPLENVARFVIPDPDAYRPFGDNCLRQVDDYFEYMRLCFDMERDHEVMRIKPDFGIDQIPPEVLLNAARDMTQQLPEAQQAVAAALDDLYAVAAQRFQNYCTKRQPQYHVYKKQAMWHFVKTGLLSDHAWFLRPFTVRERLYVLQRTLEAINANPYLHITFLKNETAFRNEEIVYYEGTGVSIIKPETDYNLQGSHRESLVSQSKFTHIYHTFFLNSIMAVHAIPERQAIHELAAMAAYLREQEDAGGNLL